jgi:acyl-CoA synthetase
MFRNGDWAFNGDLGMVDEDGYIRILGRSKDIIIQGGQNIVPTELEDLLMMHPKVANAAVIGMPDNRLGEAVCAYVIPKSGVSPLTLEETIEFLKEHKVASYKLPKRLELVSAFPTHKGDKVLKSELKEAVTAKLKAEGRI